MRTTSAKPINLHTIRKLIEYSLKNFLLMQQLLFGILRYCRSNLGRYYYQPSGGLRAKGLNFQREIKKPSVKEELVAQKGSLKKVLLEISQNSLEKTCDRVSFLIKLQA